MNGLTPQPHSPKTYSAGGKGESSPLALNSPPSRRGTSEFGKGAGGLGGFTLLEALVAIIMLAAIMAALTLALSTALRAQQTAQAQQERMGTVRAVFALITRDVQAAFASNNNPACVFMASPPGAGNANTSTLLTLTTLTHRIDSSDPNVNGNTSTANAPPSQNANADLPQADFALVRYAFDPVKGVLTRVVSAVPNLQTLMQSTPAPADTVAQNLQGVTLRFWDPKSADLARGVGFRAADQQGAQGQSSQMGASGSAGASANSGTTNNSASSGSGDTSLPSAVEITVVLGSKGGPLASYTTTVPILTPQIPTDPNTASGTTGSAGGLSGGGPTGSGGGQ